MNTKNNNLTTKLITIGKKFNKELGKEIYTENNNNNKKVIESYNSKNNDYTSLPIISNSNVIRLKSAFVKFSSSNFVSQKILSLRLKICRIANE